MSTTAQHTHSESHGRPVADCPACQTWAAEDRRAAIAHSTRVLQELHPVRVRAEGSTAGLAASLDCLHGAAMILLDLVDPEAAKAIEEVAS